VKFHQQPPERFWPLHYVKQGLGDIGCVFFDGIGGSPQQNATAALSRLFYHMRGIDDRADVERVLAGDTAAFEGIVRRWQGPLVNMAYRFCRDRSRAEEMAQEAFLRAYRKLSHWRSDAPFSSWLFTLAANLYRSELRRIPIRAVPLEDIPEPRDPRIRSSDVEIEQRENTVRQAVTLLPPKYRDVVILYYFQGQDVSAAAKSLGMTEGTLKSRLFRARELLRNKLSRVFAGSPDLEEVR
jgi:RNA polymerase sigma-70 factor, ECF subfamily